MLWESSPTQTNVDQNASHDRQHKLSVTTLFESQYTDGTGGEMRAAYRFAAQEAHQPVQLEYREILTQTIKNMEMYSSSIYRCRIHQENVLRESQPKLSALQPATKACYSQKADNHTPVQTIQASSTTDKGNLPSAKLPQKEKGEGEGDEAALERSIKLT
ncbi:hypothetical protein Tco_0355428 [Tanacetum coccineum]